MASPPPPCSPGAQLSGSLGTRREKNSLLPTELPSRIAAPPVRVPAPNVFAAARRVGGFAQQVASQGIENPGQFVTAHQAARKCLDTVRRPEQGAGGERVTLAL